MRRVQKITGQMSDLSEMEVVFFSLFYNHMNAEQLINSTPIKLKLFFDFFEDL